MKPTALFYLLWDKNIDVLKTHLARIPSSVVLFYGSYARLTPELIQQVAPGRALDIAELIDEQTPATLQMQLDAASNGLDVLADDPHWPALAARHGVEPAALALTIRRLAGERWPLALHLLNCLEAASALYDIRLILLNEDVTSMGRIVTEWGRAAGVKSLLMQHGLLLSTAYTVHRGLFADYAAVFGSRGVEAYLDLGIAPQRLFVTGHPAWDSYHSLPSRRLQIRQALFSQHRLNASHPTVVFGTTWSANLTALCDENVHNDSLNAFLAAVRILRDQHPNLQAVVKDRAADDHRDAERFAAQVAAAGLPPDSVYYALTDTEQWVVSADIVISVDSNLSVEAVLAGVPSINLTNAAGLLLGPSFGADSGIVEVEADDLTAAIARLLDDPVWRQQLLADARRSRSRYHDPGADTASHRVAELIERLGGMQAVAPGYIWQQYLEVEEIDATGYHGGARADLVNMFSNNPRLVLDIGCAAGGTGELIKRRFPDCKVWGVETNRSAAAIASQRLDRVLVGMFEDFDLEKEGMAKGTLDGVILADVLEHMYNPWSVMMALQSYLSTTAQVIISIPNVRNLKLMEDMAAGYWRYDSSGLLDITHIRFFTLREFRRFLHETGYHVNSLRYGIDQRLGAFYEANKDHDKQHIEMGRMRLADVDREELSELCSLQFYINAGLGALSEDVQSYHATDPYADYLARCRIARAEGVQYDRLIASWPQPIKVAVLVRVGVAEGEKPLIATVKNLRAQLYQQLVIWVVSPNPKPENLTESDRFHWLHEPAGLQAGLQTVTTQSDADWLAWLNAGDLLEPQALLRLLALATHNTALRFIYTDEDVILAQDSFGLPVFKADFDAQFLLSMPYLGGMCAVRRDSASWLAQAPEAHGAEHVALALSVWQRWGAAAIGHIASVLYHRGAGGVPLVEQLRAALQVSNAALRHAGVPATLVPGWRPGSHRWQWQAPLQGCVSLLLPVRDDLSALQRCLEAVLGHTHYADYEILLLDNASTNRELTAFVEGLDAMADPRIRVFRYADKPGLPQLYNLLANEARGDYLCLLHYDMMPLEDTWLDGLLGELQRPGVGMVTPRQLDEQGRLRGGGLILGADGGYAPAFAGLTHDDAGPLGRAHVAQTFSAVTAGCLLLQRALFMQLDGLDDAFADGAEIDMALRLSELGLSTLWTPFVSVITQGAAAGLDWRAVGIPAAPMTATMVNAEPTLAPLLKRWLPRFARDPAYNPNLNHGGQVFVQEQRQPLQHPLLDWKPIPRVIVHPADFSGCGQYRIMQPATAMQRSCLAETLISPNLLQPSEHCRLAPDSIVLQRQILANQVVRMRDIRRIYNPFMVYELDDLITNLPAKSLHQSEMPAELDKHLREALSLSDRFIVSTEPLAHAMRAYNQDIRVVPNRLDGERWLNLHANRREGGRPRVGWAGGVSHSGDLELIAEVVKTLATEVDWVFLGMCPEQLRPHVREFYPGVPFDKYPAKLASLGLDLALAPLEINAFNESKSNLKLLEYGVLGYPVICTDALPYQGSLPVTRLRNKPQHWIKAIREQLADRGELQRSGQALREAVLNDWMLDPHLADWLAAWLP